MRTLAVSLSFAVLSLLVSCIANNPEEVQAENNTIAQAPLGFSISVGDTFTDCSDCPEFVVIPAGRFTMGSSSSKSDHIGNEGPQRLVEIPRKFAVGKYEVTKRQYRQFVEETGRLPGTNCYADFDEDGAFTQTEEANWQNPGFIQTENHPVVCVNWYDAQSYAQWLSKKTGKQYRLPSEAEFEYVNRAGSNSSYFWGNDINQGCEYANGVGSSSGAEFSTWLASTCEDGHLNTAPVGSYKGNRFGLHDTSGNVMEWVEDWFEPDYSHAPSDGSNFTTCNSCSGRVVRGGSWSFKQRYLRTAHRGLYTPESRSINLGFRLARDISE